MKFTQHPGHESIFQPNDPASRMHRAGRNELAKLMSNQDRFPLLPPSEELLRSLGQIPPTIGQRIREAICACLILAGGVGWYHMKGSKGSNSHSLADGFSGAPPKTKEKEHRVRHALTNGFSGRPPATKESPTLSDRGVDKATIE